jgi:predicted ATPase with chaperone activity
VALSDAGLFYFTGGIIKMAKYNDMYNGSSDYIVSEELRNSVNIAIALQKPLLIKGEPGTGKTMLAQVSLIPWENPC